GTAAAAPPRPMRGTRTASTRSGIPCRRTAHSVCVRRWPAQVTRGLRQPPERRSADRRVSWACLLRAGFCSAFCLSFTHRIGGRRRFLLIARGLFALDVSLQGRQRLTEVRRRHFDGLLNQLADAL